MKVYKQIYNTEFTLEESLKSLGKFEELIKKPEFKTEYLDSNLFLYKKYAVPLLITTKKCNELNKEIGKFDSLGNNLIINVILAFLGILNYGFTYANGMIYIPIYILMLVLDSGVIFFATQDLSTFTSPGIIFVHFKEKDYFRVFNLTFRIIYLVYAFLQNFVAIFFWVYRCKKERQRKANSEYDSLNGNGETPLSNKE